jgi:hypothetical protein
MRAGVNVQSTNQRRRTISPRGKSSVGEPCGRFPNPPTGSQNQVIERCRPLARQYRELFEDMQYLRFLSVILTCDSGVTIVERMFDTV